MLHGFNFSKLIFFVSKKFFSTAGTYTLGVRRTPNQIDNDVTCGQGKSQKKD